MVDRQRFAYGCVLLVLSACTFDHAEAPDAGSNAEVTVSFGGAEVMTDEESGTVSIPVMLSGVATQPVTVDYAVGSSATATRPDDFALSDGQLVFMPGQVDKTIEVAITNDMIEESDETIVVQLSMPVGATLGATATYTVTISNSILSRVSFADPVPSSANEATSPQVEVKLSLPAPEIVTVELGVAGSASAQDRGVTNGQVITFQPSETSKLVPLDVVQDLLDEDDETIDLTLQNPTGKLLIATTNTARSHTITDDDPLPTVGFVAGTSMTNESQAIDLTVQLSAASGRVVTVAYAATFGTATSADATVTGAPGTVTFMPGQTTKTISIAITNDSFDEPAESLTITLASPVNATLTTTTNTLTITDDDNPPSVSFAQGTASVGETMATTNLTVQLSSASAFDITVPFALGATTTADNPEDFTLPSTATVLIPAGMTTGSIAVSVKADTLDEANETVVLTLGTPTNATLGATTTETLTITDDDASPTVAFTSMGSSPNEGNSNITLTVQLSDISGQDVTVPFSIDASSSAVSPADFAIAGSSVMIPAGDTSTTLVIAMKEDTIDESDETVIVVLGNPTNATLASPSMYTLTIRDDDSAPDVSWNAAEANLSEPEGTAPPAPMTRQVTFTMTLTSASALSVTVPIDYTGTATLGTDYTAPAMVTFAPGATTADVVLVIDRDADVETNETITMTINTAAVTNAGTTNPTVRTYTIQNDD